jgi:hypothetical protein
MRVTLTRWHAALAAVTLAVTLLYCFVVLAGSGD